jgi:tetratricopeptide (TPR) repeat protein
LSDKLKPEIEKIKQLIVSNQLDYAQFECSRFVIENSFETMPYCMMSYILYLQANFRGSQKYALLAKEKMLIKKDWRDILSVSNACLMIGEEKTAVEVMSFLANIDQIDANYVQDIAKHFGKIDRLETAVSLFQNINPSEMNFHSWQMYGVALTYLGRFDEALQKFNKAIEINPLDCISYNEISNLGIVDNSSQRILNLEEMTKSSNLDDLNKAYAYFALYNEYDQTGQNKKAIESLKIANETRRKTVNYDPGYEHQLYENIISQFSEVPDTIETDIAGAQAVTPIFIVGMPRTGTTMLEKILDRHADVHSCGELRTMRMQLQIASGIHLNNPSQIGLSNSLVNIDYSSVGSEYLRNVIWRIKDSRYFTDKHPSNNVFCGMIALALPNAKILHITKNPMDACFSNYKKLFSFDTYTYSYSLEELASYYKNYCFLMDFWERKFPKQILRINYEQLVLDTNNQAERIRKFCGFPQQIKENQDFVTNTLSAVQVRKPIHAGNINAWAKYAEQLKPLREALDEEYVAYMRPIEGVQIL